MIHKLHRNERTFSTFGDMCTVSSGNFTMEEYSSKISHEDILKVTNDYMNKMKPLCENTIPVDEVKTRNIVLNNVHNKNCVGFMRYKGRICGAVIAVNFKSELCDDRILHHTFYNTDLSPYLRVNALRIAFSFLVAYAKRYKYDRVVAMCSTHDFKHTLNRILSKEGWNTIGYTSTYIIRRL